MTLQNRVDPWGAIHAVPERGTMMGNRGGRFHRADRTLGHRRWASRHWICCELHYKGLRHEPMGQGYTALFFLDEVTALAAGHRPCFFCRRAEARAFLGQWPADAFDRQLHAERLAGPLAFDGGSLPDGAMIDAGDGAYAARRGRWLAWSFAGYRQVASEFDTTHAKLLTPPSILRILRQGYTPRWHESATNGDGT
jgi:hypothetical protein